MSKTAYEIESELKGSAVDRTGFGGRPELINFYMEEYDASSLPVLDSLTVDAFRCGKFIPVMTQITHNNPQTTILGTMVDEDTVRFLKDGGSFATYTISTKTWAVSGAPTPGGGGGAASDHVFGPGGSST